ncbi:glutaminase [Marivirga arenosa]|uniref:Glutaminase n=1 Tax=Marivirga arenosa TaxID=3059076 RepID=A0AA51X439_9BACT|nr:glutaminase [Marivirga sp. BKB1-2]WNB17184.1 glutaminase [Marivirga sp. BKB1-2]
MKDYNRLLDDILNTVNSVKHPGSVASYIPELAKIDPDKFGISLQFVNGETYNAGDYNERFSIQSISKVFTLSMAIQSIGDKVWDRVDVEPSGDPFNSLVQLEHEEGIPRNPFINSGAIVICDILFSELENPKEEYLKFIHELNGSDKIKYNELIYKSEKSKGYRNIAMANFIKSFKNLDNDPEDVLDFYFYTCSIDMSCVELAWCFQLFAQHGKQAADGTLFLDPNQIKRINAIMLTCGFYDESGEFAFRVGLPGKSGVGGGIVAVHPGEYSIAVWSPKLNEKGNSAKGMHALELFTTHIEKSIF